MTDNQNGELTFISLYTKRDNMKAEDILNELEEIKSKNEQEIALKVISKVIELLPKALEVQPKLYGIVTGMGSWSFVGNAIGFDEDDHEECEVGSWDLEHAVRNNFLLNIPTNEELIEVVRLMDILVDTDLLNWSSCQNGIVSEGVMFNYDDSPDKGKSPFGIPSRSYIEQTSYYKALVRAKIPTVFMPYKK